MLSRKLALALSGAALALVTGCRSTSNRVSYCTEPTVVATPAAVVAPAPCGPSCPSAAVVAPPAGFVR